MSDSRKGQGRININNYDQVSPAGKSWFYGIGINKYSHFQNLKNAVKDVHDVFNCLKTRYTFTENNAFFLEDKGATREAIIAHFEKLETLVSPKDKLLIYYSGHGHVDWKNKGYWIPTNATNQNTAHYIRNSTIRDYLETINSLHTLLISDACFSGSLLVEGVYKSSLAINALESRKSRWGLASGRHDEEVVDGIPGQNSPFASSIIETLNQNNAPKLNIALFSDQVIKKTRANYSQLPQANPIFGVGDKGGQFVFTISKLDNNLINEKNIEHPNSKNSISTDSRPEKKNKINFQVLISILVVAVIGIAIYFLNRKTGNELGNGPTINYKVRLPTLNSGYDDATSYAKKLRFLNVYTSIKKEVFDYKQEPGTILNLYYKGNELTPNDLKTDSDKIRVDVGDTVELVITTRNFQPSK